VRRAQDELGAVEVEGEQAEVAVVLDARVVEVGEIAAVVDDPLRIGIGEADAGQGRKLEGRLAVRRTAEVHAPILVWRSSRE
jgi:hypothetical protein